MIDGVGEVDEPARQHPEVQDMRMGVDQAGHHHAAFDIDPAGVGTRRFRHGVPVPTASTRPPDSTSASASGALGSSVRTRPPVMIVLVIASLRG
ncbi:hypothetical protein [Streptomyces sp. NPDC006971]|uniref:hypothetical protein n=1 Tax=Streptomyces sp. NPDC006971 TaxID=3154784 RepID=UPI0034035FFB